MQKLKGKEKYREKIPYPPGGVIEIARICSFQGCTRDHYENNYCKAHNTQWLKKNKNVYCLTPLDD